MAAPYPGYYNFMFVEKEEVEVHRTISYIYKWLALKNIQGGTELLGSHYENSRNINANQ